MVIIQLNSSSAAKDITRLEVGSQWQTTATLRRMIARIENKSTGEFNSTIRVSRSRLPRDRRWKISCEPNRRTSMPRRLSVSVRVTLTGSRSRSLTKREHLLRNNWNIKNEMRSRRKTCKTPQTNQSLRINQKRKTINAVNKLWRNRKPSRRSRKSRKMRAFPSRWRNKSLSARSIVASQSLLIHLLSRWVNPTSRH